MAKRVPPFPGGRYQRLSGLGDVDYDARERAQRELIGSGPRKSSSQPFSVKPDEEVDGGGARDS
ncbi:MAG TPA: hypothetical protein VIR57_14745 [Chloroflexota bacterium]|jgi:hypothetical protein